VKVFIETGTFKGDNVVTRFRSGVWDAIHTIEIDERYYHAAKDRFAGYPGIIVHHGSSPDILPTIMDPKAETTFYLDAHKTGTGALDTMGVDKNEFTSWDTKRGECPIIDELRAIVHVAWIKRPTIIIDDAQNFSPGRRFWRTPPSKHYNPKEWPSLDDIMAVLVGWTVLEVAQIGKEHNALKAVPT